MIVYEKEKQLGLENIIRANAHAFYSVKMLPSEGIQLEKYPLLAKAIEKRNLLPSDLFVFDNILVSSNWNMNDDIFLPDELGKSWASCLHKPLNYNHDKDIILGHTIAAYPVDDNYHILTQDVPNYPDLYHIYATDVIYTKTQNPEFDEYVQELIGQIRAGEWSVSMECRMENFDYGLLKDGKATVIPRTEETAEYSQHLRLFGGTGEVDGYKIGRVFRGINFIGKGVVRTPANPYSIIFSEKIEIAGYTVEDNPNLENTMDEKELELLKTQVSELQKQLDEAKAALDGATQEAEAAKKEKKEMEDNWKKAKSELDEVASQMNSEDLKRIKRVGAKAERVESLLKMLVHDELQSLYDEASTFAEENAEVAPDVFERMAKLFVEAKKGKYKEESMKDKAEDKSKASEDEPDLEEDTKGEPDPASASVEDDNPLEFTRENQMALASFIRKNGAKNAFNVLKEKK